MASVKDNIMDAIDIETFLVCSNEDEGRKMTVQLMQELGFNDVDIVFIQFQGPGVKVRARAYVHRSGDIYGWLSDEEKGKGEVTDE